MKTNTGTIAKDISRLNNAEIEELTGILLNKHNISATIYRFGAENNDHPYPVGYHIGSDSEANNFDVRLVDVPRNSRLRAVKLTKEMLNLGLKDAKYLVDTIPVSLKEFATWEEAEKLLKAFEEIGAEIEINPS